MWILCAVIAVVIVEINKSFWLLGIILIDYQEGEIVRKQINPDGVQILRKKGKALFLLLFTEKHRD